MIVQNLAVQRGQWLSFLCCYVVCETEKTICPLPRLKFILKSIKNVHAPMKHAVRNLCSERLGVLQEFFGLQQITTVQRAGPGTVSTVQQVKSWNQILLHGKLVKPRKCITASSPATLPIISRSRS